MATALYFKRITEVNTNATHYKRLHQSKIYKQRNTTPSNYEFSPFFFIISKNYIFQRFHVKEPNKVDD